MGWSGISQKCKAKEGSKFIKLPAYSPELNPVERLIEELRKSIANKVFESLDEIEDKLIETLREYMEDHDKVRNLCAYPWISDQLKNLHLNTY